MSLDMLFKTYVSENTEIVFLLVPFQEAYEKCSALVDRKECNHGFGKKHGNIAFLMIS